MKRNPFEIIMEKYSPIFFIGRYVGWKEKTLFHLLALDIDQHIILSKHKIFKDAFKCVSVRSRMPNFEDIV